MPRSFLFPVGAGARGQGTTMTEQEWLACADPAVMLVFLRGKGSDRKLRLFACACCRAVWPLLDPIHCRAVEVAERYADQLASEEERDEAFDQAHSSLATLGLQGSRFRAGLAAA